MGKISTRLLGTSRRTLSVWDAGIIVSLPPQMSSGAMVSNLGKCCLALTV